MSSPILVRMNPNVKYDLRAAMSLSCPEFHRTLVCRVPVTTSTSLNAKIDGSTCESGTSMPIVNIRASAILSEFEQAQTELVSKAVILTDGKAGTVDHVWLDELHGLRISIRGHHGKWPISTVRFTQTG